MHKKLFFMVMLVCVLALMAGLTSCGEKGGVIHVSTVFPAAVHISDSKYQPVTGAIAIPAYETRTFPVDDDGQYYVNFVTVSTTSISSKADKKEIYVSGGKQVGVILDLD